MCEERIVEEIRQAREAYAARFNYDIAALVKDVQERQFQNEREVVTLPPKRLEKPHVSEKQPNAA